MNWQGEYERICACVTMSMVWSWAGGGAVTALVTGLGVRASQQHAQAARHAAADAAFGQKLPF